MLCHHFAYELTLPWLWQVLKSLLLFRNTSAHFFGSLVNHIVHLVSIFFISGITGLSHFFLNHLLSISTLLTSHILHSISTKALSQREQSISLIGFFISNPFILEYLYRSSKSLYLRSLCAFPLSVILICVGMLISISLYVACNTFFVRGSQNQISIALLASGANSFRSIRYRQWVKPIYVIQN